jgi:precorrin-6B methylase 2
MVGDSKVVSLELVFVCTFAFAFVLCGLIIRLACNWWSIPWPYWLAWFLKNPYMKLIANPESFAEFCALKPCERILDVGCGAGRVTLPILCRIGRTGHVTAIDLQLGMIKHLEFALKKSGFTNCSPLHTDVHSFYPGPASFDCIVFTTSFGEIPERFTLLSRLIAALLPKGRIAFMEVLPDPCFVRLRHLERLCIDLGCETLAKSETIFSYFLLCQKPPDHSQINA